MGRIEPGKVSKLNGADRKVLTVYSDMSMETGAKIASSAAQSKDSAHKMVMLKV